MDHYQPFTPEQLKYLPLNTALKAPPTDIKLSDIGRPKPTTGNHSYSAELKSDTGSSSESDTGSESSNRYAHTVKYFSKLGLPHALGLSQASNLDLFSATRPNKFAETLSFLLEFYC